MKKQFFIIAGLLCIVLALSSVQAQDEGMEEQIKKYAEANGQLYLQPLADAFGANMNGGIFHGAKQYMLQKRDGHVEETSSISAGLDYPGVGPEHSFLHDIGRVSYESIDDEQALEALDECSRLEGILPALESAHALAGARRRRSSRPSPGCGRSRVRRRSGSYRRESSQSA